MLSICTFPVPNALLYARKTSDIELDVLALAYTVHAPPSKLVLVELGTVTKLVNPRVLVRVVWNKVLLVTVILLKSPNIKVLAPIVILPAELSDPTPTAPVALSVAILLIE